MAKSILEEALEDAKLLKETAIENAQNVLVEAISPQIKEFVDSYLTEGESALTEMPDEFRSMSPEDLEKLLMMLKHQMSDTGGDHEIEMTPGESPGLEMDLGREDPFDNFGGAGEEEEDMNAEEGMYESSDEQEDKDEREESCVDETVNIDEADLKRAWAEVVREASMNVSEGGVPNTQTKAEFDDAQNPNKNAKGGLGEPGAPGERGLEDKEKEEMWKDHEPPASSDWTVKENAYRKEIANLRNRVGSLKTENAKLNTGVGKLQKSLMEVNLFNSKLLFTNKLLQKTSLTNEQRFKVIEAFDRAETLREVQLVYKSLSESFEIAGVLSESKQRTSKKPKSSRFATSATANMLREHSERRDEKSESNVLAERMQRLAGLDLLD